jgi:hypothetical protein
MDFFYIEWIDIILSSSCVNIVHTVKLTKWTLGQIFFCQILVHPTMPRPTIKIYIAYNIMNFVYFKYLEL